TAGGGMITATVNGKKELLSVKIDPEVVDPDDVEMLEDLVTAAVNEALSKAGKEMESKMGAITGGMNLPGMF
ncbi:MAG: YbaB/EbfC family nucleoid-associated protein, partial [Clostridia bacterium]|nr:YbaB/EbfC family nucleoid-associated protein [Clostridia bacterium]